MFIVIGCGKQADTINKTTNTAKQEVKASDSISFEMKSFKKTYKDCKETEEKCSYLKILQAQKESSFGLFSFLIENIVHCFS